MERGVARGADPPERLILVEGESDRVALETLAERRGLARPEIVVLGGAHAVSRFHQPAGVTVVGLCDANEAPFFHRVLEHVCVCEPDLEGELIRALGAARIESIIERQGELRSFRTLQKQPVQRSRTVEAQLVRFLGGRAGNKERYARLFVEALELDRVPAPLDESLLG